MWFASFAKHFLRGSVPDVLPLVSLFVASSILQAACLGGLGLTLGRKLLGACASTRML